jgi:hypothetical protein
MGSLVDAGMVLGTSELLRGDKIVAHCPAEWKGRKFIFKRMLILGFMSLHS